MSEATFFRQAPVLKDISSSYFGIPNLTRRLTDLLVGRIKAALPNIKWEVRYNGIFVNIRNTTITFCPAVDACSGLYRVFVISEWGQQSCFVGIRADKQSTCVP